MALNIYNKLGKLKLTVEPDESSTHVYGIMEDNVINLSFTLPEYVLLDVDDFIDFAGNRYWMIEAHVPQQKSTVEWSYSPKFYGAESMVKRGLVLKMVDNELSPEFSLTAPAIEHLRLFVDNINRVLGTTGYKVGDVIASENILIEYNATAINEGLNKLAEQTATEWWFDGQTVNLTRCEHGTEVALGYRNGLTKLERTVANNVKFFTRLFPLGSTRNIDFAKYGANRLQLPGGKKYVEQNVDTYGIIEHSEESAFSHIYPSRVGVISAVRSEEVTGQNGDPFKIYYFKDSGLPFDPNDYEIGGLVKQITLQSGELNGRDFEVNYDSKTKEFEIVTQFPEYTGQLPNDILTPKTGDKYVLWNITMPSEYYALAEQNFLTAVNDYMADNVMDKAVYKAPTDYIDMAARGIELTIGRRVRLESDKYFPGTGYRSSRITHITQKINQPAQMDIEVSDVLSQGKVTSLSNSLQALKTIIEATRGGLPDVIKTWEGTKLTDTNILSSLRVLLEIANRALSRLNDDTAAGVITFLRSIILGRAGDKIAIDESSGKAIATLTSILLGKEIRFGEYGDKITVDDANGKALATLGSVTSDLFQSKLFAEGALGSGFVLRRNEKTGKSYLEIDELFVRMKAYFAELMIEKLSHVGGQIILTPARMKCVKVEEFETYYRCFFNRSDDERTIINDFLADDQARCQTFNIKTGASANVSNSYYWRLVVAVGDDYIDLSKQDCDTGSTVPAEGDEIVQLGNRGNTRRQNAIVLSAFGNDNTPSITQYAGINSYSLSGKEVTKISPSGNSFVGDFKLRTGENLGNIADAANTAAKAAQATADAAQESLKKWSDDSCISPTEKLALKNEQAAIRAERSEITADATKYGVNSNAFLTAHTAYDADLTYYTRETPENIEILASFSVNQKAYYDARTAILNAIATAIKSYIQTTATTEAGSVRTELQTQINAVPGKISTAVTETREYASELVNAVKVGGRNRFVRADWEQGGWTFPNGYLSLVVISSRICSKRSITAEANTIYSFKNENEVYQGLIYELDSNDLVLKEHQWIEGSYQFTTQPTTTKFRFLGRKRNNSNIIPDEIWNFDCKLEKGNKYTDWSPAPEDTDAAIQDISDNLSVAKKEFNTSITQLSKQIELKVSQEDFNALGTRVKTAESSIEMLPGEITLAVKESKEYADGVVGKIQIGGRNLLRNSPGESNKITYAAATNDAYKYFTNIYCNLSAGSEYTISYKTDGVKKSTHGAGQDGVGIWLYDGITHYFLGGGRTFTVNTSGKYWIRLNIYLTGKTYSFWDIKVEAGNKATDWSPAPEDVDATIENVADTAANNLSAAKTDLNSSITQLSKQIELKVSQTDFNALGNRVSTAESTIEALPDKITLAVLKESKEYTDDMSLVGRGEMLYRDPTFKNGNNSINVYNNLNNGTVSITRVLNVTGNLNNSGYCLKIVTTGTPSPGWGGFTFTTPTKANRVLITRIVAKIPAGRQINWHSNGYGNGASGLWLTSQAGTDNWEEYVFKLVCGASGTFSTTNFFALSGGVTPTATVPLEWYVAFATVYDVTSVDDTPTTSEITTSLTIDTGGISLLGKKISLTGMVTFNSLANDAQLKINTAQSTADTATGNAATAQNTANTAVSNAATAQSAANNAQTSANSANTGLTSLQKSLGDLAYEKMVSFAKLDSTIIEGGYIKTNLINADEIITDTLLAGKIAATAITTGKLTVTDGSKIGGLKVSGNALTNEGFNNDAYIILRNDLNKVFTGIGVNIWPATGGGVSVLARFENEQSKSTENIALRVSAKNSSAENIAIAIAAGYISGFAVKCRQISTGVTLTHEDTIISCYNTATINVYLPSSPQVGKIIMIIQVNSSTVNVYGNGKRILRSGSERNPDALTSRGEAGFYIYDGQYWHNGWLNH